MDILLGRKPFRAGATPQISSIFWVDNSKNPTIDFLDKLGCNTIQCTLFNGNNVNYLIMKIEGEIFMKDTNSGFEVIFTAYLINILMTCVYKQEV